MTYRCHLQLDDAYLTIVYAASDHPAVVCSVVVDLELILHGHIQIWSYAKTSFAHSTDGAENFSNEPARET